LGATRRCLVPFRRGRCIAINTAAWTGHRRRPGGEGRELGEGLGIRLADLSTDRVKRGKLFPTRSDAGRDPGRGDGRRSIGGIGQAIGYIRRLCIVAGAALAIVSCVGSTPRDEVAPDLSTYVGASGQESVRDIAIDRDGSVYLTGGTDSPDFPTTRGAYSRRHGGAIDVFVMKLDSEGHLVWSTLLGGPSVDRAYAIKVDSRGYVYVAGRAGAAFPVTPGVFQTEFNGGRPSGPYPSQSGFVAKLSPDGGQLIFASYFGARDDPSHPVRDLALDDEANMYLAASTSTGAYPPAVLEAFQRGFQPNRAGGKDGVLAKLAADGTRVIWATYLGGSGIEEGAPSIGVDSRGHVYYLTTTTSADIRTTPNALSRVYRGNGDFYLAKLHSNGRRLVYATYLGGSESEDLETHNLAIAADGTAYVAGGTTSPDFPTTPGAFQRVYGGSGKSGTGDGTNYRGDAVVAKLSSDGTTLLASTYIGGRFGESAEGVAIDASGSVHFSGATFSDDFPVTRDALQRGPRGAPNAIAVKLAPTLDRLLFSTYLGSRPGAAGRAAAVDVWGRFYIAGETTSRTWPVHGAFQPRAGGGVDGVLARFRPGAPNPPPSR